MEKLDLWMLLDQTDKFFGFQALERSNYQIIKFVIFKLFNPRSSKLSKPEIPKE